MKVYQVIKRNEDFRKVYSNGISKANRLLVMYILKNETDNNRFGISVSKKVGVCAPRNVGTGKVWLSRWMKMKITLTI